MERGRRSPFGYGFGPFWCLGLGLGTADAQNQPQSTPQGQVEGTGMGQGASQTESNDMGDERPARWVHDLAAVRVLTAR